MISLQGDALCRSDITADNGVAPFVSRGSDVDGEYQAPVNAPIVSFNAPTLSLRNTCLASVSPPEADGRSKKRTSAVLSFPFLLDRSMDLVSFVQREWCSG